MFLEIIHIFIQNVDTAYMNNNLMKKMGGGSTGNLPKQKEELTLSGEILYKWFSYICSTIVMSWYEQFPNSGVLSIKSYRQSDVYQ